MTLMGMVSVACPRLEPGCAATSGVGNDEAVLLGRRKGGPCSDPFSLVDMKQNQEAAS